MKSIPLLLILGALQLSSPLFSQSGLLDTVYSPHQGRPYQSVPGLGLQPSKFNLKSPKSKNIDFTRLDYFNTRQNTVGGSTEYAIPTNAPGTPIQNTPGLTLSHISDSRKYYPAQIQKPDRCVYWIDENQFNASGTIKTPNFTGPILTLKPPDYPIAK